MGTGNDGYGIVRREYRHIGEHAHVRWRSYNRSTAESRGRAIFIELHKAAQ